MDHTGHHSLQETYRLAASYDAPAYVKNASVTDIEGDPNFVYSGKYLDGTSRKYPVHTKVATWTTAAQLFEKEAVEGELDAILEDKLEKAAAYHGIDTDVKKLRDQIHEQVKLGHHELQDSDFALVKDGSEGRTRMYPLRDAQEVKQAEQYLLDNVDEFTYPDRRQYARNLIKKAEEFGCSFEHDARVATIAGYGFSRSADVAEAIRKRVSLSKVAGEVRDGMLALADSIEKTVAISSNEEVSEKIALELDAFDRRTALDRMYSRGLERPEEVMYAVTVKQASDAVRSLAPETPTGRIYSMASLQELPLHAMDRVRPGLAYEVDHGGITVSGTKLASLIPEMTYKEARALDRVCEGSGVYPEHVRDIPETAVLPGDNLPDLEKAAESYVRPVDPNSLLAAFDRAMPVR